MNTKNPASPRIAFFGTPAFAVHTLDELEKSGFTPSLIITALDRPAGRNLVITPPPVKLWAQARGVPVLQPVKLTTEIAKEITSYAPDLFIVSAYGIIMPKHILDIPPYCTLNIHPSLLPRLRGASPVQSTLLSEHTAGVTVMVMDELMDHGPILAQKEVPFPEWPERLPKESELEETLAREGARLLAEHIPAWVSGQARATEQDHARATYCKKIKKEDGLLDLSDPAEANYRKIKAFDTWPRAYFFVQKHGKPLRVIITEAELENGTLVIKRVIPEGKKEMEYEAFLKGNK